MEKYQDGKKFIHVVIKAYNKEVENAAKHKIKNCGLDDTDAIPVGEWMDKMEIRMNKKKKVVTDDSRTNGSIS